MKIDKVEKKETEVALNSQQAQLEIQRQISRLVHQDQDIMEILGGYETADSAKNESKKMEMKYFLKGFAQTTAPVSNAKIIKSKEELKAAEIKRRLGIETKRKEKIMAKKMQRADK